MKDNRLRLTTAELIHLLWILDYINREGVYYGNHEQFIARRERLEKKIRTYFDLPYEAVD